MFITWINRLLKLELCWNKVETAMCLSISSLCQQWWALIMWQLIWCRRPAFYLIPLLFHAAAAAAKSLQSCPILCDPMDSSPPGSPIPGILQARILEWVAISFSNAWRWKVKSAVAQSCLTLSDPMDCSLPGSSVHGIFQARVLEWGAMLWDSKDELIHVLL